MGRCWSRQRWSRHRRLGRYAAFEGGCCEVGHDQIRLCRGPSEEVVDNKLVDQSQYVAVGGLERAGEKLEVP